MLLERFEEKACTLGPFFVWKLLIVEYFERSTRGWWSQYTLPITSCPLQIQAKFQTTYIYLALQYWNQVKPTWTILYERDGMDSSPMVTIFDCFMLSVHRMSLNVYYNDVNIMLSLRIHVKASLLVVWRHGFQHACCKWWLNGCNIFLEDT